MKILVFAPNVAAAERMAQRLKPSAKVSGIEEVHVSVTQQALSDFWKMVRRMSSQTPCQRQHCPR